MKKIFIAVMFVTVMLSACVVPGRRGPVVVAPPLPSIVVLKEEPHYYHSGYYYYYHKDRWSYSNSRSGPWKKLPKGHYPKEVKFKERGRDDRRGRDWERGHERDDRRNKYDKD
jgi:hypothetical protein